MQRQHTFADRLKELMTIKGLSKSDVARICGINKSNVTRYCNGEYEAKQDVIYRMASQLNVSASWLMGYDTPMTEDVPFSLQYFAEDSNLNDKQKEFIRLVSQLTDQEVSFLLSQVKGLLRDR